MNRILMIWTLFLVTWACTTEAGVDKRSLGDLAARLWESGWEAVAPEGTKQTCRGLGWVDGPNAHRRRRAIVPLEKRGLLDPFIPTALANAVGAGFGEVFPASMQDAFCTTAGMVKPGGAPPSPDQIRGVWAPYGSQQVLVTPSGEVYDTGAHYLGTAQALGIRY